MGNLYTYKISNNGIKFIELVTANKPSDVTLFYFSIHYMKKIEFKQDTNTNFSQFNTSLN